MANLSSVTSDSLSPGTFWALITPAERDSVTLSATTCHYPARTTILRVGAAPGSALVLLHGRVKVVSTSPRGYRCILAIRVPGDIVGEMATVSHQPRMASVTAIDGVTALRIPAEKFVTFLRTPHISQVLLQVVSDRLRNASQRRAEFGDTTAAQRLNVLLAELAASHGDASDDKIAITLPFSQEELAGAIAASRKAVVRALGELRDTGIISTNRQQIVILRPDALSARQPA